MHNVITFDDLKFYMLNGDCFVFKGSSWVEAKSWYHEHINEIDEDFCDDEDFYEVAYENIRSTIVLSEDRDEPEETVEEIIKKHLFSYGELPLHIYSVEY